MHVVLSVAIQRLSVLIFHLQANSRCDFIAGPAAFHDVVSAGAMLCFILSVGFVSILRTELAIPRYCLLH